MKLREYLKDHPIVSILGLLASIAGIATFLLELRTGPDNKENVQEKHQVALGPTVLPNPEIKKDSSATIKDSIIEIKGNIVPKDEVVDVWIEERSDTLELKADETFFLPGQVRMSASVYAAFSYVNVFFPGEQGRSYKREELQMGEEKHFESPNSPYKFDITYLSFSNYAKSFFIIKVWKRS